MSEHLEHIRLPILVVQGALDAFGSPDELRPVLSQLKALTRLFVVEGGDHSFTVPKKWPKSQQQVYAEIQAEIMSFIRGGAPLVAQARPDNSLGGKS